MNKLQGACCNQGTSVPWHKILGSGVHPPKHTDCILVELCKAFQAWTARFKPLTEHLHAQGWHGEPSWVPATAVGSVAQSETQSSDLALARRRAKPHSHPLQLLHYILFHRTACAGKSPWPIPTSGSKFCSKTDLDLPSHTEPHCSVKRLWNQLQTTQWKDNNQSNRKEHTLIRWVLVFLGKIG